MVGISSVESYWLKPDALAKLPIYILNLSKMFIKNFCYIGCFTKLRCELIFRLCDECWCSEHCFVVAATSQILRFNYLLCEHIFVRGVAGVIYLDKCSMLAKSLFNCVDGLIAFDLYNNYRICKAFVNECRVCYALWNYFSKYAIR